MAPFKFIPQLKPVLWGGRRITQLKHLPGGREPIGESWEISAMPGRESVVAQGDDAGLTLSQLLKKYGKWLVGQSVAEQYGERFPLLVKIIDAHQPLSIQVHPGDELAAKRHGCAGKTEMWYIVEAQPESVILAGLNQPLAPAQFETLLLNGQVEQCVAHYCSAPGDVFFLPPGTIHSIGAGNLLVEIQQASDITYRLWDYGRRDDNGLLRQLHLEEAREAINYAPNADIASHCDTSGTGETVLASCPHFHAAHLAVDGHHRLAWVPMRSFLIMVGTQGSLDIVTDSDCHTPLDMGESVLIPAGVTSIEVTGRGQLVMARMPNKTL